MVDSTTTSVLLKTKGSSTLYVEASYDGINWSPSSFETYEEPIVEKDYKPLSVRFDLAPYSNAIYYFYNGHYIDKAKTLMGTLYGLSTSLELDWNLSKNFRLYPELGYTVVLKIQTVIPKQQAVHYLKAGAGLDYLFNVTNVTNISLGLLGGAMAHINNKKANITPYVGARAGFETKIEDSLYLGMMTRVSAAWLPTSNALTDSVTILVDPASLSLRYEF